MMAKGRRFATRFKARVELEALRKDKTVQEIATRRQMHSNHVIQWNHNARGSGVYVRGMPGRGTAC